MAIKLLWTGLFLTIGLGTLIDVNLSFIGMVVMGVGVVLLWLNK